MNNLYGRLGTGVERRQKLDFLQQACVESGPEFYFWLSLLAGNSKAVWLSPSRVGFRTLAVLDPRSLRIASDLRFPCLELSLTSCKLIGFPQLTVDSRPYIYRLDGLMGVWSPLGPIWINLEIDGAGHFDLHDLEREQRLEMPTLRIGYKEMQNSDCLDLVQSKLARIIAAYPGAGMSATGVLGPKSQD